MIHFFIAVMAAVMGGVNIFGGAVANTCLWLAVCFYAASVGLDAYANS